jgi:hypothetical protein
VSYGDLLKDVRWQKKRLEVLNERNWKCEGCGTMEGSFHVHHRRYRSGAKPWEYDSSELRVLCEECHTNLHRVQPLLDETLLKLSSPNVLRVLGYAQALLSGQSMVMGIPRTLVRVIDHSHSRGISDALSCFLVGYLEEFGGEERIFELGQLGPIDPATLHETWLQESMEAEAFLSLKVPEHPRSDIENEIAACRDAERVWDWDAVRRHLRRGIELVRETLGVRVQDGTEKAKT